MYIKDFIPDLRSDSRTDISDGEHDEFSWLDFGIELKVGRGEFAIPERNFEGADCLFHAMKSIGAEIHHDLMNLGRIGEDGFGGGIKLRFDGDGGRQGRPEEFDRLLDQMAGFQRSRRSIQMKSMPRNRARYSARR